MANGGNVYFIPPEYYGGVSLGNELQQTVGNVVQLRVQRRRNKKEDERTEEEKRRYDQEYENKLDELAITKASALASVTGRREDALKVLQGRGIAPNDARIKIDPKELVGDIAVGALQTPVGQRTPEQQLLVRNALGLPQEFSPEQVLELANNTVKKAGFELQAIEQDATTRQQFRDALKAKGMTEGQVNAQLALLGISAKEQDIALGKAQAQEATSQAGYYDRMPQAGGGAGGAAGEILQDIIKNSAQKLTGVGVPTDLVVKHAMSLMDPNVKTSPEEDATLQTAFQKIAAAAAASGDPTQLLDALVTSQKAGIFGEQAPAQLTAAALNEAFAGKAVATAVLDKGFFRDKWRIQIDPVAAAQAAGAPDAEIEQFKQRLSTQQDLSLVKQNVESLQPGNPMKPVLQMMITEEERRRATLVAPAGTAPTTPQTTPAQATTPEPVADTPTAQMGITSYKKKKAELEQAKKIAAERRTPAAQQEWSAKVTKLEREVATLLEALKTAAPMYYETVKNK